jgi:hypothetical protein
VVTAVVYYSVSQELMQAGLTQRVSPWAIAIPAGSVWLVWFVMLGVLRRVSGGVDHPPVDDRSLPPSRAILFWTVVVTFILIFMPVPFRTNIGPLAKQDVPALGETP